MREPLSKFLAGQAETDFQFPEFEGQRIFQPTFGGGHLGEQEAAGEGPLSKMLESIMRQSQPELFGQAGRTIEEQLEGGFAPDISEFLQTSEDAFSQLMDRQAGDLRNLYGSMGQRYGSEIGEAEALMRSFGMTQAAPIFAEAGLRGGVEAARLRSGAVPTAANLAGQPTREALGLDIGTSQAYQSLLDRLAEDYYRNLQGFLPTATGFATGFPPIGQQVTSTGSSGSGITPLLQAAAFMAGSGVFGGAGSTAFPEVGTFIG